MTDSSCTLDSQAAGLAAAGSSMGERDDFGQELLRTDQTAIEQITEDDAVEMRLPPFPRPWKHPLRSAGWLIRVGFGAGSLLLLLAVIAAIPIVNFLALGYLLDAEGRVARSGRIRDSVPLIHLAPRLGSIALGFWLWLLPLRFLAGFAADAQLIAPDGLATRRFQIGLTVAWVLISIHLCLALARGGSLGCFFRPLKNLRWLLKRLRSHDYWTTASTAVRGFVRQLELRRHFVLGLKGFAVAFVWLVVPTALYAAMKELKPGPGFVTIGGGVLLLWVFAWIPFLQARFASQGRWRSGLELRETRELFRHAPFAWLIAVIGVYVLSLPLYLTKVVLPPADAMWLLTLVFIATIYPARILTGWAYHRAVRRRESGLRSRFITRLFVKALMTPLLAIYVFILFFTQFISEHGKQALFEHHAFLLPWPG